MDSSLVYRKSGLGAAQLTADHGRALSPRERQVLVLVNGQRTIAELSDLFGADTIQRLIPDLEAKGFAKRVEPKIGAELGGTVTQLHVASLPRRKPSRPARDLRAPRVPIVWIGLSLALIVSFATWTAHRFSSQPGAMSRFDAVPVQPQPIVGIVEPAPTVASDENLSQQSAPVSVPAASPPPAASAFKAVPASPARSAQRAAPGAPEAVEATAPTALAAVVAAMDAPMPVPGADPRSSAATADPPGSAPTADPSRSAPIVDPPSSAPVADPPSSAPVAEPPPAVPPANPQAAVAETKVAMQDPSRQAPGDQVSLRPLRHDPPRIPPKARLDGVVEGHARARLWVTAEGKVDQVDIIEATPQGVLDDEIRRALSLWTYDPPGRSVKDTVELTLKP
jgi:TonB family protein